MAPQKGLKGLYFSICLLDGFTMAFITAITILNAIFSPETLSLTVPISTIHITNYIINMRTKYKYTIVPVLIKIFLGHLYNILFVMNYYVFNIPLIILNTIVFFASFVIHLVHGSNLNSKDSPDLYEDLPAPNQPILGDAKYIANAQQAIPGNQQQVIYIQPNQQQQQLYYYYPQQNTNGNAMFVQGTSGQVIPQYYPQQTQNVQGIGVAPNVTVNKNDITPQGDNMITNGENNN